MRQLDSENADRNLTSYVTVLTHTPSTTIAVLCQAWIQLGDAAKALDGSGGFFDVIVSIGGQIVQPSPQTLECATDTRTGLATRPFMVPANAEVVVQVRSPNAADTDVDVTATLYEAGGIQPETLGRAIDVETDGSVDVGTWRGSVPAELADTDKVQAHIAEMSAIKAKTDLITMANVTVSSVVTTDQDLVLVQYDDYLDANSRAISWSNTSGDWFAGDLTDATVALTIVDAGGYVKLTKAGSVVTATGTQEVSVELTSAETGLLTEQGRRYHYQLLLTKATHRETEVDGDVIVALTNNEPP